MHPDVSALDLVLTGDATLLAIVRLSLIVSLSAVAIAFAREGADVAIAYLPSEEADAKEVINLIEAEGHTAVALSGDITSEKWCTQLVDKTHRLAELLALSLSQASIVRNIILHRRIAAHRP